MAKLTRIDRYIYASRFKSFLEKHDEAVALLTSALAEAPEDVRLLRFRGHRLISTRDYDGAIKDLQLASELMQGTPDEHEFYQRDVEPDLVKIILGQEEDVRDQHIPVNEETIHATTGMYKSTLHGSVWYHLAVAEYLLGNFEKAKAAFDEARAVAVDDDLRVAIFDWQYMCLRRLGRHDDAAHLLERLSTSTFSVSPTDDFYLRRLRFYKGELTPDELLQMDGDSVLASATQGYGVGNWYLYTGDMDQAVQLLQRVLSAGYKYSFAYLAAEADLARLTDMGRAR